MTLNEIASLRILHQQLAGTKFTKPQDLVGWMGALQAQDFTMSKWAVGIRLSGTKEEKIETALNKGELLRTHVLRPTWHLISAKDIYWMLELTAPHINVLSRTRHKELELDNSVFKKSHGLIEKALMGNKHLTREELATILEKSNIAARSDRGAHLMFQAELDGIVCSGAANGTKQTYALLSERVPKAKSISREEALAKLAQAYFNSHCPATLQDFTWWSGLPLRDARIGLEAIRADFIEETIQGETYWFPNSFSIPKKETAMLHFLPAFDEMIIGYKTRIVSLTVEQQKKAFTLNGIFKPLILQNGKGIGLWKRTVKKDIVVIETDFFSPPNKTVLKSVEKAAEGFGDFVGKKTELVSR